MTGMVWHQTWLLVLPVPLMSIILPVPLPKVWSSQGGKVESTSEGEVVST